MKAKIFGLLYWEKMMATCICLFCIVFEKNMIICLSFSFSQRGRQNECFTFYCTGKRRRQNECFTFYCTGKRRRWNVTVNVTPEVYGYLLCIFWRMPTIYYPCIAQVHWPDTVELIITWTAELWNRLIRVPCYYKILYNSCPLLKHVTPILSFSSPCDVFESVRSMYSCYPLCYT